MANYQETVGCGRSCCRFGKTHGLFGYRRVIVDGRRRHLWGEGKIVDPRAEAAQEKAREEARAEEERFRSLLDPRETERYERLERDVRDDRSRIVKLDRAERRLYRDNGHEIEKGTRGRALEVLKDAIAAQLSAEARAVLDMIREERRHLSEAVKENEREIRQMIRSKGKKRSKYPA